MQYDLPDYVNLPEDLPQTSEFYPEPEFPIYQPHQRVPIRGIDGYFVAFGLGKGKDVGTFIYSLVSNRKLFGRRTQDSFGRYRTRIWPREAKGRMVTVCHDDVLADAFSLEAAIAPKPEFVSPELVKHLADFPEFGFTSTGECYRMTGPRTLKRPLPYEVKHTERAGRYWFRITTSEGERVRVRRDLVTRFLWGEEAYLEDFEENSERATETEHLGKPLNTDYLRKL